jgi:hypothetical protein
MHLSAERICVAGTPRDHISALVFQEEGSMPTHRAFGFSLAVALLLSARNLTSLVGAPQGPCDPNLKQLGQDPQGYQLRGDRCEGIYIQPVSGSSTLLVASFTASFEDFDPSSTDKLTLEWSSLAATPLRLRAYALREKLYYQMDSVVPADKATYLWPTGVLNALHLSKQDIGVVGFTEYRVGSEIRTLYVPLRIQSKDETQPPGYQLVLLPGSELDEVFVSLAQVGTDGQPHSFLISDRKLGKGYYPAERGISIDIPRPPVRGVYYVEIGATRRYAGPLTQQIWFYSAGGK